MRENLSGGETDIVGGMSDSLIFVSGDPEPKRVTKIIVNRRDGERATYFSQGMLAGANLVEYIESTHAYKIISIEEFGFTGADHPLQP